MAAESDRKIDYVEFNVDDVTTVRQFYQSVFGWKFNDYGPAYTDFSDGRVTGGFAKAPRAGKGALVVMYASDLAAARDRIVAAGGKLVGELIRFPGGCRFHFTDPSGNELAVWSETEGKR